MHSSHIVLSPASPVPHWIIAFNQFVLWYFILAVLSYVLLIVVALHSSARHRRRIRARMLRRYLDSSLTPAVAVLVPTYNEQISIVDSVRSLLQLKYPALEVVVINDGSTDQTLDALRQAFDLVPTNCAPADGPECSITRGVYISPTERRLLVIDKRNGGKSDALNAGLRFAGAPYFCAVDADTLLEPDALVRIMAPLLEEPGVVVASGGIVRISNGCRVQRGQVVDVRLPSTRVGVLQVLEYLRSFLFGRQGWGALNSLLIISGAFGVFSRDLALEIGGYRRDTVAEDMDLVVRMHRRLRETRRNYRVCSVPDPVAWTQVPTDTRTLARQRRRWQKGLVDVLWHNRRLLFNPAYGRIGLLALPYQLVFELCGPWIEMLGIAAVVAAWLIGILNRQQLLDFALIAYLFGTAVSLCSVLMEEITCRRYNHRVDLFRLMLYSFADFFPYRQFLHICRMWGTVEYLAGDRHKWGEQRRAGHGRETLAAG